MFSVLKVSTEVGRLEENHHRYAKNNQRWSAVMKRCFHASLDFTLATLHSCDFFTCRIGTTAKLLLFLSQE